ncbi:MAG: hypothetical protein ACK5B9_05225 [Flavobacteriia bacterium]|jgi:hypothetical protein
MNAIEKFQQNSRLKEIVFGIKNDFIKVSDSQNLRLVGIMKLERNSTLKSFYIDKNKNVRISFISINSDGNKTVSFYTIIHENNIYKVVPFSKPVLKIVKSVPYDFKFKFSSLYCYN